CTLAPSGGGLQVTSGGAAGQDNGNLSMSLNRTISGPLTLASNVPQLSAVDSIVDAAGGAAITASGAAVNIQTSTVFGTTAALSLEAGNSIFTGVVTAQRAQIGCVRFCYLPFGSQTARRYRFQPDLALKGITDPSTQNGILARLTPQFASVTYGQPGYAQLS